MTRKLAGGLVALIAIVFGIWFLWLRDRGGAPPTVEPASTRSAEVKPAAAADKPAAAESPRGVAPTWNLDVDREGPLRLEGQVVGPDGNAVGGAKVTLSSVPPRTATSEQDGGFAFDKLIGRTYSLSARTGDLLGAARYKLTETSDPVVIRLSEGAAVLVTVTDDADKPIAGAEVSRGKDLHATTDAAGHATVRPVEPGWVAVEASAPGYAPARSFTTIGSAGATGQISITLKRGFGVSGQVVDERGKPVAKANVGSTADGVWGFGGSAGEDVVTDAKGRFQIEALAPGSHVLSASDGEHAPARSAPVTVTDRAVSGITITMKDGGTIAGIVLEADHERVVPYATVRVAGKGQEAWTTDARQTTTDQVGRFELRGLPRGELQLRAESDVAASKITDIDLAATARLADLRLVLDVTGQITGVVVDENGAPVPEVQVNAFPDLLGGNSLEGIALAGMSSATTDGAGAFAIRGLPDGAYRLWAARSMVGTREWGQQGTAAKTGDTGVKIVLAAPGELKGTLALEGASTPPEIASVQVGWKPPTPANKGVFVVKDVTPGTYDVTFRGPQFAVTIQRGITITPGETTDMGTVTVVRGRRLTGKVVDGRGAPVAGAKIRAGQMLISAEGSEEQLETIQEMSGIRSAISDQAGEFAIIGVPKKETNVMADHPERGRSTAVSIPAGTDDPPPMTLALRGYGSITGKVTQKGKPVAGVTIGESSQGGGAAASFTKTADDGTFTMARVPEGPHVIQAMQQAMMSMRSTTATVTVVAGKQATVTIDIPVGELTLVVNVKPLPGNQVDAAQVFLFKGAVSPTNAKELTDGFFQGGAQGMKFWLGGAMPMPEFTELVAGGYSVCTIPITGSLSDPTFQARLQENMVSLKVYCKQVRVTPSPAKQETTHEVPAMSPLPAPSD